MYTVRKLKLDKSEEIEDLCLASGELYTKILIYFWRVVRRKKVWLSANSLMKLFQKLFI